MKHKKILIKVITALFLLSATAYAVGKLQNADFATQAQIEAAGGTKAQLLNGDKVYLNGSGFTLNEAISTGTIVSATGQLDSNFSVKNAADLTKQFKVSLTGAGTSTGATLMFNQTVDSVYAFPSGSTTVVGHDRAQTLTNKTMDYALNTFLNFPGGGSGGTGTINQLSGDVTSGGIQIGNASVTVNSVGTLGAQRIHDQIVQSLETASPIGTSNIVSRNASGEAELKLFGGSQINGLPSYRVKDDALFVEAASPIGTSNIVSRNAAGEVEARLFGGSQINSIPSYIVAHATSMVVTASAISDTSGLVSRNAFGGFRAGFIEGTAQTSYNMYGILAEVNGGTGANTRNQAVKNLLGNVLQQEGDLVSYSTGADMPFRVPGGLNGQALVRRPTATAGLNWETIVTSSGSGGSSTVYQFSGYHTIGCSGWTRAASSDSFFEMTGDNNCVFNTITNTNFGTVTSRLSAVNGQNGPGLSIASVPATGIYHVCMNTSMRHSTTQDIIIRMVTSTPTIITEGLNMRGQSSGEATPVTLCGNISLTSGAAIDIYLEMLTRDGSGTLQIGTIPSTAGSVTREISYSIFKVN